MADPIESIPIPDTPPPKSGATQGSIAGIAAIKKACAAAGIDSKYAICSILGIAGTESKWMFSAEEGMNYSQKTLLSGMFSNVSQADAEKWYNAGRRGIPRVEFFGWLYGTRLPGGLPSAGNYYGRGFIQLTNLDGYKQVGKSLGIDLVKTPDLVRQDADFGAKVVVEFFKWKMPNLLKDQYSPGFFEKALGAVRGAKSGWPEKRKYYEYFLGGKSAAAPTNKDATATTVNKTPTEIASAPANKRDAYTEDRSANFSTEGFTDPEGKYPLRDFMNEPDTNRLARGVIDGTHINFKDSSRKTGIPIANTSGTYDQPKSAYNTVYPYNKVFESESGHVLEFDDSPEGERVNLYHSKGTFIEIDPNGSQINYIVGDGFYITEQNGNIFINGTCNVTSSGPMNILCKGDANIEVEGQVDAVFHNNVNMGVALDLNIAVGGDYNLKVEGNYNAEIGKTSNTRSIGTMSIEATDALKLKTAKSISMEGGDTASTAETLMKMSSSFKLETPADFQIKAKNFTLDIEEATEIKTKTLLVEVEDTTKIKTKSFQLDTTNETNILTGMFNTTTKLGVLQLNSMGTAVINAVGLISGTAPKIDLNGAVIPPTVIQPITDIVEPLELLGAPKVPVDFKGDAVEGRKEEQVLVDTTLNPAGEYNPNTLSENVINSVLNNIPIIGGVTPNVYDTKYSESNIETKTTLSTAGASTTNRLVVPPVDYANQPGQENLVPPERHSETTSKYETEEDWASVGGQKLENKISSTSDYEHNHVDPTTEESTSPSGGKAGGTPISSEKLSEINSMEDFPLNYRLSEHFTLGMLCKDGNLQEQTVGGKLYTKSEIVANLTNLCVNILEPIYNEIGVCQGGGSGATWRISDGFRPNNRANSNGSKTSHHLKGRAVDIQLVAPNKIPDLYDLCVKLEKMLPYQECFMEYAKDGASRWIHLAYDVNNSSKEVTTQVEWKRRSNKIEKLYS